MSSSSPLKPSEVIESFETYGSEMIHLDLEKMRESGNKKVKYINVMLKKTDGSLVPLRLKFLNQKINNSIKKITERNYEQIKISFKDNSEFCQAACLIAEAFCDKVSSLNGTKITDDRKKANKECILMPTVKPNVPVQTSTMDKDDNVVEFEEPIFWVRMNSKRYSPQDLESLPSLEEKYKESGNDILIKKFEFNSYNFASGKPVKVDLDYENCYEAFTRNTIVSGVVNFQVVVSVQGGFNLNACVYRNIYYITADRSDSDNGSFEEDEFAEMAKIANASKKKNDEEYDNSEDLNEIANLTFE